MKTRSTDNPSQRNNNFCMDYIIEYRLCTFTILMLQTLRLLDGAYNYVLKFQMYAN